MDLVCDKNSGNSFVPHPEPIIAYDCIGFVFFEDFFQLAVFLLNAPEHMGCLPDHG
jgi:hypothetical protein